MSAGGGARSLGPAGKWTAHKVEYTLVHVVVITVSPAVQYLLLRLSTAACSVISLS